MRNKKDKNTKLSKEDRFRNRLKEEIFGFFDVNYEQAFSENDLYKHFGVRDHNARDLFSSLLKELAYEGRLTKLPDGTYQAENEIKTLTGRVEHVNSRFAFVVRDDAAGDDIYVDTRDLNDAVDGDLVQVSLTGTFGKDRRPEGEVTEILERKRTEIVGTLEVSPRFAFVTPDSRRLYQDIYIAKEDLNSSKTGDKVIVAMKSWGEKPTGVVKEVLGKAGEHNTEMHAILAEFGLANRFSDEVEKESEAISEKISEEEIKRRRDFRNILTFTIDPADAKDFDDALSFQQLKNGNYEIGVHIADVTHYVLPDTELEKEALRRGTSVYLVDRTVPMLPEKLSNNLCSLRPNEDKLTFSAVFEITPTAQVKKQWFGRTIIHSDKRFSYEEAQELLDLVAPTSESENDTQFHSTLLTINDLAKKLRDARFKNGAINFETVEVKFNLDENGKPLGIYQKVRKDAHKLIEEFMLLANKKVAEYVYFLSKTEEKHTMVYRIHEAPNFEKLTSFVNFAKRFGYNIQLNEGNISSTLNHLMTAIEGRPEQNILESLAIRSMSKARYSTEAIGHFGLAFEHYSHFTSPIRRYPDMMAHRFLQHYLLNGKSLDRNDTELKCKQSSTTERIAAEAERASIKYKQVEYMSGMEPNRVFDGIVSGVTEFGVFVEITETASEGLVRMSDLSDDFYEFDKENLRIVGKRSGRVITFGDAVSVKVKETNLGRRSMDLWLVSIKSVSGRAIVVKKGKSSSSRGEGVIPKSVLRKQNTQNKRRKR